MSETIGFIITRSFSIAKIKKGNIPVEGDEMLIGIDTYNDLITQLQIDGITLGASITLKKEDKKYSGIKIFESMKKFSLWS